MLLAMTSFVCVLLVYERRNRFSFFTPSARHPERSVSGVEGSQTISTFEILRLHPSPERFRAMDSAQDEECGAFHVTFHNIERLERGNVLPLIEKQISLKKKKNRIYYFKRRTEHNNVYNSLLLYDHLRTS